MKKLILFLLLVPFIACKETEKKTAETKNEPLVETQKEMYPEALSKVFEAHGGLTKWNDKRTLSFVLQRGENPETHTVDLRSRNERIENINNTVGFDGKPWVLDTKGDYKGNPEFYHNLMFYFYAMPFVLGDKGIVYNPTEDLTFEGVSYPGMEISFNDGVGTSPKDNYYIHYNADTNQMEWLGYTVTYRTGEKSEKVNWIRYNDWKTVNDLVVPNSISWYKVEEGEIKEVRNQVFFENITISDDAKPVSFYSKPDEAVYWEKPASE